MNSLHGMLAKVSKELNKVQVEKQELATINFVTLTIGDYEFIHSLEFDKWIIKDSSNIFQSNEFSHEVWR